MYVWFDFSRVADVGFKFGDLQDKDFKWRTEVQDSKWESKASGTLMHIEPIFEKYFVLSCIYYYCSNFGRWINDRDGSLP